MKAYTRDSQRPLAITSVEKERRLLERSIRAQAADGRTLDILEAGCGQQWGLDLAGVSYVLTGLDIDQAALHARRTVQKDLDKAILGDLRTAALPESGYDVIYSSFVLEHIAGADRALENFLRWLRPGGLLILRVPDGQSVYGGLTRWTPFWVHVWYKRYVAGCKEAGQPGVGPFPTVYDPIIARNELRRWCHERGLIIRAERGWTYPLAKPGILSVLVHALVKAIHVISLGRWADKHINLTYVVQKPGPQPLSLVEDAGQPQEASR